MKEDFNYEQGIIITTSAKRIKKFIFSVFMARTHRKVTVSLPLMVNKSQYASWNIPITYFQIYAMKNTLNLNLQKYAIPSTQFFFFCIATCSQIPFLSLLVYFYIFFFLLSQYSITYLKWLENIIKYMPQFFHKIMRIYVDLWQIVSFVLPFLHKDVATTYAWNDDSLVK